MSPNNLDIRTKHVVLDIGYITNAMRVWAKEKNEKLYIKLIKLLIVVTSARGFVFLEEVNFFNRHVTFFIWLYMKFVVWYESIVLYWCRWWIEALKLKQGPKVDIATYNTMSFYKIILL